MGERITDLRNADRRVAHGRTTLQGTVLARVMHQRRYRNNVVAVAMHTSDRMLSNYLARRWPVPARALSSVCELLDMDPDELVDEDGFLSRDNAP